MYSATRRMLTLAALPASTVSSPTAARTVRPSWNLLLARSVSTSQVRLDVTPNVTDDKKPQLKKFWRAVTLRQDEDGFQVLLDGRVVKTPQGTPLSIPKSQPMIAHLVSAEWESQQKLLRAFSLPLTSLLVRAKDDFSDPDVRKESIDKLMKFLQTDATCFHEEFPEELVRLQQAHWDPLLDWARTHFSVAIHTTNSLLGTRQPDHTSATLRTHIEQYSPLQLAAFEKAVLTSKSFLIGLALTERVISAQQAADAARVEVQAQIDRWGEVEDAHDVEREDIQRVLAASALVVE
ncbi:hypothetical protein BCR44DRAFT_55773 [Catenaria anguillulae PL171]|uniref:ATP12-domain-containing protein n=1 Tax=Catenaria anguillulae PL171 TaxID=765915 RepID=A0A1Y2HAM5_9FUNG|nr:hypothetical protein BCR44DRAFT_55773 [Catenaria anguillulae PL171]